MIKKNLRKILVTLNLPLTKNLKYDILSKKLFKKHLTTTSNTIDIGCHKGEILDEILKISKNGKHYGFEPIPEFYTLLKNKYNNCKNIFIYSYALSDYDGQCTFNFVKNAPAYSGIKKRKYDTDNPLIEEITVETKKLDSLNINQKIDLIKIDVEGGEYNVLLGATNIINKNKPLILFEFGKGASDYYNVTPDMIYNYFYNLGMGIFNLRTYFTKKENLSLEKFSEIYEKNSDYIFIAIHFNAEQ